MTAEEIKAKKKAFWEEKFPHKIGTAEEQHTARMELLKQEKALIHQIENVVRLRRQLPWVQVSKDYEFIGVDGPIKLSELFNQTGKPDLIVYHFMYDPSWDNGCSGCSAWADCFNGVMPHLLQHANFAAVGKAPISKLVQLSKKKDWSFRFVSSESNTFNRDFRVEWTPEEIASNTAQYNYGSRPGDFAKVSQGPGASVFRKENGVIYHTYSTFARGLETLNSMWAWLDLLPDGRGTWHAGHKEEYKSLQEGCQCKH